MKSSVTTRPNGPSAGGATAQSQARRRVTIRDVANLAQVSLGTVSNVLNNPAAVATPTRNRVLEAINSTGFVRSTAAHQLRVGKSRTIGVVLLDIGNPFFAEMVRGAEHVLRERDYVLNTLFERRIGRARTTVLPGPRRTSCRRAPHKPGRT